MILLLQTARVAHMLYSISIIVLVSILVSTNLLYSEFKQFVCIVASYNNKRWYKKNLDSLFYQTYPYYRIIYIDDCSTDSTGNLVEHYIHVRKQHEHVTLIKNTYRRGALANIYDAIHSCLDHEIIVIVDGDDWLAHNKVLQYLNTIYQNQNVWLTYGQFMYFSLEPTHHLHNKIGLAAPYPINIIQQKLFRQYPYILTHIRTYYAWLFKQIKLSDLLYNGYFYTAATDPAVMYPMIEMAGDRFAYISDILYIYNLNNPLSHWQSKTAVHQEKMAAHIQSKKPYTTLTHPIHTSACTLLDVLIKAETYTETYVILMFLTHFLKDIAWRAYSIAPLIEQQKAHIQHTFKNVIFFSDTAHTTLKRLTQDSSADYILVLTDTLILLVCDIKKCLHYISAAYADICFLEAQAHSQWDQPLFYRLYSVQASTYCYIKHKGAKIYAKKFLKYYNSNNIYLNPPYNPNYLFLAYI